MRNKKKEEDSKNKISIDKLTKIISIVVAIHYFISYRWLNGVFKIWGVNDFSIISIEDLTFTFIETNLLLFSICILGTIGTFFIHHSIKDTKETIYSLKEFFNKKKTIWKFLIPLLLIVLITIFYFSLIHNLSTEDKIIIFTFLLVLFIPLILGYVYFKENKETLILNIHLIIIFLWANIIVSFTLKKMKNNTPEPSKYTVSFNYKNSPKTTSDSLIFLHQTKKFLILKENKEIIIYKNENIENIRVKKN